MEINYNPTIKGNLTLESLHNPANITEFLHKNGNTYALGENQAFQTYERDDHLSVLELWQQLTDGRLMKVQGWYRKSIVCTW